MNISEKWKGYHYPQIQGTWNWVPTIAPYHVVNHRNLLYKLISSISTLPTGCRHCRLAIYTWKSNKNNRKIMSRKSFLRLLSNAKKNTIHPPVNFPARVVNHFIIAILLEGWKQIKQISSEMHILRGPEKFPNLMRSDVPLLKKSFLKKIWHNHWFP